MVDLLGLRVTERVKVGLTETVRVYGHDVGYGEGLTVTVIERVNGHVVAIGEGLILPVTDWVSDVERVKLRVTVVERVKGHVVAIGDGVRDPVGLIDREIVTDTERVNGHVVAIGDGLILLVTDWVRDVERVKVRVPVADTVGKREGGTVIGGDGLSVTDLVKLSDPVGLTVTVCDRVILTETVGDTDRV